MTTIVSPSASSANTVVLTRMNWMFVMLRNRGWIDAVTATNSTRTTMMPDSLIRNARSVSLRAPVPAGAGGRSLWETSVVLTVPPRPALAPALPLWAGR